MKEEALKRILKTFFKQSLFADSASTSSFVEQWLNNNRYKMDVMTLIDEPRWKSLRTLFFNQCTRKKEDGVIRFKILPNNVFEWIKSNIK